MPVQEHDNHFVSTKDGSRHMGEYEAHMYQFHGKELHPTHVDFDGVADAWKANKAAHAAMMAAFARRAARNRYNANIQQAQQGNVEAMMAVGKACAGALEQYEEAAYWYNIAVDKGHNEGFHELGNLCRKLGKFDEAEYDKAIKWYSKAVESGYRESLFEIPNVYLRKTKGIGAGDKAAAECCRKIVEENTFNLSEQERARLLKEAKYYENFSSNETKGSVFSGFTILLFIASAARLLLGLGYDLTSSGMMTFWLVLMTSGIGLFAMVLFNRNLFLYQRLFWSIVIAAICIVNMYLARAAILPFFQEPNSLTLMFILLAFWAFIILSLHFKLFLIPQILGSLLCGIGFGLIPLIVIVGFVPSLFGTPMLLMSVGSFVLGFFLFLSSLRKGIHAFYWFLGFIAIGGFAIFIFISASSDEFITKLKEEPILGSVIERVMNITQNTEAITE